MSRRLNARRNHMPLPFRNSRWIATHIAVLVLEQLTAARASMRGIYTMREPSYGTTRLRRMR